MFRYHRAEVRPALDLLDPPPPEVVDGRRVGATATASAAAARDTAGVVSICGAGTRAPPCARAGVRKVPAPFDRVRRTWAADISGGTEVLRMADVY